MCSHDLTSRSEVPTGTVVVVKETPPLAVRLLVCGAVLAGVALSGVGLPKMVYFARTSTAQAEARVGHLLLALGCALLIMCALIVFSGGQRWAAAGIAAPAVICGGLALVAEETLFPQLAALPTFAMALAGAADFAFVRSASS